MAQPSKCQRSFHSPFSRPLGCKRMGVFMLLLLLLILMQAVSSVVSASVPAPESAPCDKTIKGMAMEQTATSGKNTVVMHHRRRLRSGTECTLYMREMQYTDHSHFHSESDSPQLEEKERTWMCEVSIEGSEAYTAQPFREQADKDHYNRDRTTLRSSSRDVSIRGSTPTVPIQTATATSTATTSQPPTILVEVKGLDEDFFELHGAKSGLTVMKISDGYLEEADEEEDQDGHGNVFVRMGGAKDSSTVDRAEDRNRPTTLTKMVVSPDAVVDLVDLSLNDEGEDDEMVEMPAAEVRSGNIFSRGTPPGGYRNLERVGLRKKRNRAIGELTTLVVRIIAPNGAEPSNDVRDTEMMAFYDEVCLKSQYAACSMNQMIIKPFQGTTSTGVKIERGVVNVEVDINPRGPSEEFPKQKSNIDEFASRADTMTEMFLGNITDQFDLVLFCIPPGTADNWKAFANVNRYDSYYNDRWCGHISAQLHEVGHNLNLAHSGEGDTRDEENLYEDKSGMMGSSYPNNNAPKMCFNGAKNYQLNWYANQQLSIDPTRGKPEVMTAVSKTRTYVMNGIVDYKVEGDTQGKLVSLRLDQQGTQHDYYIGYNRASGFNEGTQEDVNQIVVWEKPTGGPYNFGESWKVTTLRYEGQRYIIQDFGPRKHFVEIKLLTDPKDGAKKSGKKDVSISVTSYKAAAYCKYSKKLRLPFKLQGKTDNYGFETSWSLREDSPTGGGYMDFGSGYDKNTEFESTKVLCPGQCYVLEFNDLFGDGLCDVEDCGDKAGFFKAFLDGEEILSGTSFSGKEVTKRFCVPEIAEAASERKTCADDKKLNYENNKKKNCFWVRRSKKKRCGRIWKKKPLSEWCPSACRMC